MAGVDREEEILGKWSLFVCKEIERLAACSETTNESIVTLRVDVGKLQDGISTARQEIAQLLQNSGTHNVDIALLKLKSGAWGLLGGLIPSTGIILFWVCQKLMKG